MARPWKSVAAEVHGLKQITVNLNHVVEKIDREVNRKALRKAVKPMLRQAKANARASDKTGLLRRSLGVKVKTYPRKKAVTAYVGPRTGFETVRDNGQKQNPIRYAHLIELGRKTRAPFGGTGFLEKAFKSTRGEALEIWRREVKHGIPVAVSKVTRRLRRRRRGR